MLQKSDLRSTNHPTVRFGTDSLIARVLKVVQFCVMTALAAESPSFVPREFKHGNSEIIRSFFSIDVILLISRAGLMLDYLIPLCFLFRKKQTKIILPLALCSLTFLISVIIYAGLLPTFTEHDSSAYSYRAWYVILAYEVVAMIAIACIWDVLSFENTHVIKRMGLLVLIILGEGILNVSEQLAAIVEGRGWDSTIFGEALTCVLTIVTLPLDKTWFGHANSLQFLIWALYFRKGSDKPLPFVKQEVFALL